MIRLVFGPVGAGKTTFAKRLEREARAVRFSHDEWMCVLYGSNPPVERFAEYAERVAEVIWRAATRLAELGVDVVLDFGFWTRRSRDAARERARQLGADVRLYDVVCPEEERRRRVLARTARGEPGTLWINEAAIDVFEKRVEPLGADEERIVVDGTAAPTDPAGG